MNYVFFEYCVAPVLDPVIGFVISDALLAVADEYPDTVKISIRQVINPPSE